MKTENRISMITFIIAFALFIISRFIKNEIAKRILCIAGIAVIIISIIFERKAKNPQNFGIFAHLSKIMKSKKQ